MSDFGAFAVRLPQVARQHGIRILRAHPDRRVARERLRLPGGGLSREPHHPAALAPGPPRPAARPRARPHPRGAARARRRRRGPHRRRRSATRRWPASASPSPCPLVALLAATAVLGPEVDDGSIVYLLSKPVSRHVVALSKFAVAWAATMALGALPLLVAGLVLDALGPAPGRGLGRRGAAVAGTAYTALFIGARGLHPARRRRGAALRAASGRASSAALLDGIRWVAIGPWGREVASRDQPAGRGARHRPGVCRGRRRRRDASRRCGSPATGCGRSRSAATSSRPRSAGSRWNTPGRLPGVYHLERRV